MRDYLIVGVILASLPIGLIMPFYGLLVYTWISYMYPHMYAWSFGQTFPVAKISALSALVGTIFARAADTTPLRERENIAMALLWGMFTISTVLAVNPAAWTKWQDVSKLIMMALLTSTLITNRKRMRYFLLLVGMSLGFYGLKGGLFSIAVSGGQMIYGPGTSIIGSNNAIGLAMNMSLPILWYMAQEERGWLKRLLQLMFFTTIPAVMFTYSRASALTLPVVLIPLMLRGKSRAVLVAIVLIAGVLAYPYIPDKWWTRQMTVTTYEADASAMSRIDNWKFCWQVAINNPVTGVGFYFYEKSLFERYAPEFLVRYGGRTWDTHNIYFAILAAHGFPGLALFLIMILFCFSSCRHMRKQVEDRPDLKWIRTYCSIVSVSFLAFLVNGFFVNMEYFDLPYDWVAVVASLKVICSRSLAEPDAETEDVIVDRQLVASAT